METIRRKSIQELKCANPPLDLVEQIVAARRYNCMELVEIAMGVLVKRAQPLSFEEVFKLSREDLHKWITDRDNLRGRPQGCYATGNCYCSACGQRH